MSILLDRYWQVNSESILDDDGSPSQPQSVGFRGLNFKFGIQTFQRRFKAFPMILKTFQLVWAKKKLDRINSEWKYRQLNSVSLEILTTLWRWLKAYNTHFPGMNAFYDSNMLATSSWFWLLIKKNWQL